MTKDSAFKATKSFEPWFLLNEDLRQFCTAQSGEVYSYDQLVSVEIVQQNSGRIGKGLTAWAYSFGLFDDSKVCNSLKLCLTLKDAPKVQEDISFIITPTRTNTPMYRKLSESAQGIYEILCKIAPPKTDPADYTDELLRLKELFDSGVITEEDFEAKKKQILGI